MTPFDPDAFVDELGSGLATEASDDVRTMIYSCEPLQVEVLGFVSDAKAGLAQVVARAPGALERLGATLRTRKTRIVAACPEGAYTVEGLMARALARIQAKAQEVARPSLAGP